MLHTRRENSTNLMACSKFLCHLRPLMPWICSSIALGYAAYLHWRLGKLKAEAAERKSKINEEPDKMERRLEVNIDAIDRTNQYESAAEDVDDGDGDGDGDDDDDHSHRQCQCYGEPNPEKTCCSTKNDGMDTENAKLSIADQEDHELPRCRRSAYSLYVQHYLPHYKHQLAIEKLQFNYPKFAKECSLRWRQMPEEGKQHFRVLSKQDKLRYDEELKMYKEKALKLRPNDDDDSALATSDAEEVMMVPAEETANLGAEEEDDEQEETTTIQPEPEAMAVHIGGTIEHNFSETELEDMAFDLFCSDEMPKVREHFAPLSRRMSGEQMLDELWRRWEALGGELRLAYKDKAIEEAMSDVH